MSVWYVESKWAEAAGRLILALVLFSFVTMANLSALLGLRLDLLNEKDDSSRCFLTLKLHA